MEREVRNLAHERSTEFIGRTLHCQAYNSIHQHKGGVPIHQLRQLLRWPRERFDSVLEELRADRQVDLEVFKGMEFDTQFIQDCYHVHGQLYVRIKWRD